MSLRCHPPTIALLLLVATLPTAQAGTLDSFESQAQPSSPSPSHHNSDSYDNGGSHSGLGDAFGEMCVGVLAAGGSESIRRVTSAPSVPDHRKEGDALLPMLRYDLSYEKVSTNIDARHHRLEAGYGPLGVMVETSIYHERNPHDTLSFERLIWLYRMSASDLIEVDLGFGRMIMNGNTKSVREVFAIPVRMQLGYGIGFDFRSTWSDGLDEYEGALTLGGRFGTVSLGYRRMVATAVGTSLEGPFAGFSVHY